MARTFILKVTKVTYSPNAPWMVRIPPGLWQLEGQKKKFFEKESVAKSYRERLGRLMVNYQLQAAALSDLQRLEAYECFVKLEPIGASLRAAVEHYLAYLAKAGKSVTLRQLVEDFLAAKKQDGVSRRYGAPSPSLWASRLQWGRAHRSAETITVHMGFGTGIKLQWGRAHRSAETSAPARQNHRDIMLQWGRAHRSAETSEQRPDHHGTRRFNGAALTEARKPPSAGPGPAVAN